MVFAMARCRSLSFVSVSLPLLVIASCTTAPNEFDQQLLTPPVAWLAEPADFGLRAEPVEIVLHSEASLTGFWIPHENGEKRTVVLFHDAGTNASVMHPYYRFLHAAGFQVLVFDPRGYGKSKGAPTLQAWLYDLPKLFAWLRERPDVDAQRIALFGTGLGSVAAMWAARTQGCQALVLEHLPSLRDLLRESQGDDGSALSAMRLGFTEFSSLPEEIEPEDNAKTTKVPALFLASDGEPARDRKALVRTFGHYAGPKQLWMLTGTGQAPHGMLTHDGEYQQQITAFLNSALAGRPQQFATTARKVDTTRDGQAYWEIEVKTGGTLLQYSEPRAIEVCAVLADGSSHFGRTWLTGHDAKVRLKLAAEPVCTSAVVVPGAIADAEQIFVREPSPLARAGANVDALWTRIETLRNDALAPADMRQLQTDLAAAEAKMPFPVELQAELGDVFAKLGKQLAASQDATERAAGQQLLQRAIAVMPQHPERHIWPGPTATYGYPQETAIAEARRLLATPPK